jgi:hypothetical protein
MELDARACERPVGEGEARSMRSRVSAGALTSPAMSKYTASTGMTRSMVAVSALVCSLNVGSGGSRICAARAPEQEHIQQPSEESRCPMHGPTMFESKPHAEDAARPPGDTQRIFDNVGLSCVATEAHRYPHKKAEVME